MNFSKLIKEARLLGCETFSRSVDAIVAKNWLKRITDTLTDMELDESLKLKVTTRLMDKSAATWCDNFKLRTSTHITWELFVQEFNDQFYTWFHRDQKRKEFFRLRQLGRTITEYETELWELVEFVLEVSNFEDYLWSEFEEGLNLEVWKKMSVYRK